jgi:hypothetical protein
MCLENKDKNYIPILDIIYKRMRYIKLYEDFSASDLEQVMMAICDEMSFSLYYEGNLSRVYTVDGRVDTDTSRWKYYLGSEWMMLVNVSGTTNSVVTFVRGDEGVFPAVKEMLRKLWPTKRSIDYNGFGGVDTNWFSIRRDLIWYFDLSSSQARALLKDHYEEAE